MSQRRRGRHASVPKPIARAPASRDVRAAPPLESASGPAEAATTETLLPHITAWPAGVALGVTLIGAGIITNLALIAVGAILFALALFGWIQEMRHEHE